MDAASAAALFVRKALLGMCRWDLWSALQMKLPCVALCSKAAPFAQAQGSSGQLSLYNRNASFKTLSVLEEYFFGVPWAIQECKKTRMRLGFRNKFQEKEADQTSHKTFLPFFQMKRLL